MKEPSSGSARSVVPRPPGPASPHETSLGSIRKHRREAETDETLRAPPLRPGAGRLLRTLLLRARLGRYGKLGLMAPSRFGRRGCGRESLMRPRCVSGGPRVRPSWRDPARLHRHWRPLPACQRAGAGGCACPGSLLLSASGSPHSPGLSEPSSQPFRLRPPSPAYDGAWTLTPPARRASASGARFRPWRNNRPA